MAKPPRKTSEAAATVRMGQRLRTEACRVKDSQSDALKPDAGLKRLPDLLRFALKMKACTLKSLAAKDCESCRGGVPALEGAPLRKFLIALGRGWKVVKTHHLEKEFKFKDFKAALAFTNRVGDLAEAEGHHPDIYLSWGRARVTIWTHAIDGLTENDFVLAAKIEGLKKV